VFVYHVRVTVRVVLDKAGHLVENEPQPISGDVTRISVFHLSNTCQTVEHDAKPF